MSSKKINVDAVLLAIVSVHQHCHNLVSLQGIQEFYDCKGRISQDYCINIMMSPVPFPQLVYPVYAVAEGYNIYLHILSSEKYRSELPVAEVRSDNYNAFAPFKRQV